VTASLRMLGPAGPRAATSPPTRPNSLAVRGHLLPERRVRDAFVNVVLAEIALPLLRVKAKRSYSAVELRCAGAGLTSYLNPKVHRRETLHSRPPGRRRDRGFATDEGAALTRSVVHGFGRGSVTRSPTAFSVTRAGESPCGCDEERSAVCSARARASGIHQSWQGLMRTIQVAEPRQMCWLPYTADMITSALEFAGGEC
jgi:hypothetical protein